VVKRAEAEEKEVTAGGEQSLASRRARACKNRVLIELGLAIANPFSGRWLAKPGSAGGLTAPVEWNPGVCKNCARAKRAGEGAHVGWVRAHADKAGCVVLALLLLVV
jgi:hypothetical protein